MRRSMYWLLRWGPVMILLVSSVLSVRSWRTYRVTEELRSEREKSLDQLRTEELTRLLGKRTEVETRLEASRLMRRAANAALLQKLEESLQRFEQSEGALGLEPDPEGAGKPDGK